MLIALKDYVGRKVQRRQHPHDWEGGSWDAVKPSAAVIPLYDSRNRFANRPQPAALTSWQMSGAVLLMPFFAVVHMCLLSIAALSHAMNLPREREAIPCPQRERE